MHRFRLTLLNTYTGLFLLYMLAPLAVMSGAAFNDNKLPSIVPWKGWTTRWFIEMIEDRRIDRFHRHHANGRIVFLQRLTYTGDGAASAHARDQNVHFAGRVPPDFLGGGATMDGRIGRILKLLGDEIA